MTVGLQIVMLAPFGIRPKGTLAARMLPLAQSLVRRGHRVTIVAPPVHNPQDAGRSVCYDGVAVMHTSNPTAPGPLAVAQQVAMLLRPVIAQPPDVVHLFKPKGYSGLAAQTLYTIYPHIPLIVDSDDWEGWGGWNDLLPYPPAAKRLFAWQERHLPRRAATVTVASRTLETQMWGFGIAPQRVYYVPNGVSLITDAQQRTNEPAREWQHTKVLNDTILLYTRFWEFDVRDIIAAMVVLAQANPAIRLVVVGRGERMEERRLLRLAQRAGLAHLIDYRGWVEPEHIPSIIASAAVGLVPMDDTLINRARGLAKLLELMAAGLPIIASRVGQATEYIEDGHSGVLVPPGDPAALAKALLTLLNDAALRAQLGVAARARAISAFNWDRLVVDVERAYAAALEA